LSLDPISLAPLIRCSQFRRYSGSVNFGTGEGWAVDKPSKHYAVSSAGSMQSGEFHMALTFTSATGRSRRVTLR